MDIRNFFGAALGSKKPTTSVHRPEPADSSSAKKSNKSKGSSRSTTKTVKQRSPVHVDDDDDDGDFEEPLPQRLRRDSDGLSPSPVKTNKKQTTKRKKSVISDSDSDSSPPKKAPSKKEPKKVENKEQHLTKLRQAAATSSTQKTKTHKEAEKKVTKITPDDFFGDAPAKQKDMSRAEQPPAAKRRKEPSPVKPQEKVVASAKQQPTDKPNKDSPPSAEKRKENIKIKADTTKRQLIQPTSSDSVVSEDTVVFDTKTGSPSKPKSSKHSDSAKNKEKERSTPKKSLEDTAAPKSTAAKSAPETPVRVSPRKASNTAANAEEEGQTPSASAKRASASGFYAFQHREAPRALGTKPIPEGSETCLSGLTFVLTGVLESIDRDDCKALIEKHGGKVTTTVSKKTSYVVLGREAGQSKLKKIEDLGTNTLDDDQLFQLITERSKSDKKFMESQQKKNEPAKPKGNDTESPSATTKPRPPVSSVKDVKDVKSSTECLSWVDKHKPTSLKQIIGQQGDKSCVHKLLHWLKHWHHNNADPSVKRPKPPPFKRDDDGFAFRAALLSGPPGIGKTTSAHLCAKELGWTAVEFNASDTRNKKSLEERVQQLVGGSRQLDEFYSASEGFVSRPVGGQLRHVLIMDEVDGMSGSQDRAGMAELIQLIKVSRVPIICICNDRQSQKIRSLANHCFDLRFHKPRLEQIRSRLLTICCQEKFKLNPQTLDQLVAGANHDVRQVIQHLNMLAAGADSIDFDTARHEAKQAHKDVSVNLFEAAREILNAHNSGSTADPATNVIARKTELFFSDYSLLPLFVQENYPHIVPHGVKSATDRLSRLAEASRLLTYADQCDRLVRTTGNWSLLNEQCLFSAVLPTERMHGALASMIQFPSWLGRNSSHGKRQRLLAQLNAHMALNVTGSNSSVQLEYMPVIRDALCLPLVTKENDGIADVMKVYDHYDLTREDAESVTELANFPGGVDVMSRVSSKVKAAFTRAYNKSAHLLPYDNGQLVASTAARRHKAQPSQALDEPVYDEEGNVVVQKEDDAQLNEDNEQPAAEEVLLKPVTAKPSKAKASGSKTATKGRTKKK